MKRKSVRYIALLITTVMLGLAACGCARMPQRELQENKPQVQESEENSVALDTDTDSILTDLCGWCGEDVRWGFITSSGTLVIRGSGDMQDYDGEEETEDDDWVFARRDMIRSIVIEPGVTSIGDNSFYSCINLTSVIIPDSVARIGYGTFAGCINLSSVRIPDSVISIGEDAFLGTPWLNSQSYSINKNDDKQERQSDTTDLIIPGETTSIPSYEYSGRDDLTSVTIPKGITHIGNYAFQGCRNLASVTIPESVISIGRYAFDECVSLTSITIPNSVTSIWDGAFCMCDNLTSITIPDSVTFIGERAFFNTPWLNSQGDYPVVNGVLLDYLGQDTEMTIPEGVTSIGDYSLAWRNGVTRVTIPEGVTSIGSYAFYQCKDLTEITIPDSVTSIGSCAFCNCFSLRKVTIPASVQRIDANAFEKFPPLEESDSEDIEIYGYSGSPAEEYAARYNYSFHPILSD